MSLKERYNSKMAQHLEETLLSARNMIDLTLLALYHDCHHLIPTALENAYEKLQLLVDDYCVEDKQQRRDI